MNATHEEWRPVVGWEGLYEVSDHGRVRSLDRIVVAPGRWGGTIHYRKRGRLLSQTPASSRRYPTVPLSRDGSYIRSYVHRLVLEAFVGAAPMGTECCHGDDDATNNHISNLRWDTPRNNGLDVTRNGNNHHANKTHCINGHEFTAENTRIYNSGWRRCRKCVRDDDHRRRRARRNEKRASRS